MNSPENASIQIACPGCQKVFQVPATAAGKRAKCRNCDQVLTIPHPKANQPASQPQEPKPQAPAPDPFADFFDEAMAERTVSGLTSTPTVTPPAPVPQAPQHSSIDQAPGVNASILPCKEADEALNYAIVSIFCCGIFLGPVAVLKSLNAKQIIAMNPRLSGSGKATAALIIGLIVTILSVLSLMGILLSLSQAGNM